MQHKLHAEECKLLLGHVTPPAKQIIQLNQLHALLH
jgi:hypothetical protein